ncbi:TIGR04282 family arsenosugar biosynthesis glycosyltransferase [Dactylosporangium sp. CA-139114]|uniref:TIGR04282 family arsenosugar biosynthesis glycosyltransferase n=1 Tax=Dactylosporangium sp. CA-139114 TaxID=3239931 RepID=UPI003D96E9C3
MTAYPLQLLLFAKAPVPGRVKTRLCPPWTPEQAATIAAAAIADTVDVLSAAPATARTLVADGPLPAPPGWRRRDQRGNGLGERLAAAYADTALPGVAALLVGMDTPQVHRGHLVAAAHALADADAVLGPAQDGGWWALGLRDPAAAHVLAGVPMSTRETGARTRAALVGLGLRVAALPVLRDVDTAADAAEVAAACPSGRFARAVTTMVPAGTRADQTEADRWFVRLTL